FTPGVEVGAEVLVRLAALENLVGDLEQGVGDRGDRLLLGGRVLVPAEAADQPVVPGLQPAPDPDRRPGGLDQRRLDVGSGVAGPAVLAFLGADVVPRAQGHQEASFSCRENQACGAGPISAIHACATASPNPGTVLSRPSSRCQGTALAAICSPRPSTAASNSLIRSRCRRHSTA